MKTRNRFYLASRRTAAIGCTLLAASWSLAEAQPDPTTLPEVSSEVPSGAPSCDNITDYLDCTSEGRQQDVVFVFDTTGSMGDEITEMQTAVIGFSEAIAEAGVDYHLGLTEYKDFPTDPCGDSEDMPYKIYTAGGDAESTLTSDKVEMQDWIKSLKPSGGNDTPESLLAGLAHTVTDQTWRTKAARMAVVITDAPAHRDGHACNEEGNTMDGVIAQLRREGIVTHVIGPNDNALRSLANQTGGTFFEIRKTQSITEILGKIAELINCSYVIRSGFAFSTKDNMLNMEIRLIGAENKTLPHLEDQTSLTVFACGGAKDGTEEMCSEFALTPEITADETVYKSTTDASAFIDSVKLTELSTLVQVCEFSKTTTKRPLHIGVCEAGVTPKPEAPVLTVAVNGNDAKASWTTATYTNKFTFLFAPYSNPLSDVTLNNIQSIDMGVSTTIGGKLNSGTHIYVAVTASNCSGESLSNIGVIEIP